MRTTKYILPLCYRRPPQASRQEGNNLGFKMSHKIGLEGPILHQFLRLQLLQVGILKKTSEVFLTNEPLSPMKNSKWLRRRRFSCSSRLSISSITRIRRNKFPLHQSSLLTLGLDRSCHATPLHRILRSHQLTIHLKKRQSLIPKEFRNYSEPQNHGKFNYSLPPNFLMMLIT